ncbi:hypothetical protein EJV47_03165 [Hymenobacter gummosus]|uniref:DUF3575 domain-containing protein n=1 Tax=Hymenobacter gummosus TaxID=1776032 RepID=A0A431U9N5_9BACT|nr:hypothetical protein [Hymenobacter gummosus]RTQ53748.1 hypothetical protein EJV47_03165 [Hymenobacter gummosus]
MRATVLLAAFMSLSALPGLAQEAAPAATAPTPAAPGLGRTVVRLDATAVLWSNFDYNFWAPQGAVLPVLASVEHHWGGRTSTVVEGLLNGGTPQERRTGVSVQGRYYLQRKFAGQPVGLYVAPTLGFRAVRDLAYARYDTRKSFAGAGVLVGAQLPVALRGRLLVDVAGGAMAWQQVGRTRFVSDSPYPSYYESKPVYGNVPVLPDMRLGLGLRF